jgi:CubicO group peptidase (beta-lactamase class C family)
MATTVVAAGLQAGCAHHRGGHGKDDGGAAPIATERLERIAPVMKQQIDANAFPGAVSLLARDGRIVHLQAHGWLDAAKTKPMQTDSIFRLASMTKPIVTTAAMMLVEQGRMQLNDPITRWLPEFADVKVETPQGLVAPTRPVTVQDLMRHTSGLVYSGSTASPQIRDAYRRDNIESSEVDISPDDMLRALGRIPLAHQPGTFWEYGVSTDVLGLLIQRVAGKRLDQLLDEMLLQPLGMVDTAFWVPPEKAARLAEAPESDPQKATLLKSYRIDRAPTDRGYLKGGGGLVGTASDYLKFAQMIANGGRYQGRRYLSAKVVDFMLSDHTVGMGGTTQATTGPGYGFGLGFGIRLEPGMNWVPGSIGDATWSGAWGTTFWVDREEQLVGMLMTQGPSTRVPSRMLYRTLVYGAVGG